ncbi:MYND-type zinc finger protein mub1 [Asimina triloba]
MSEVRDQLEVKFRLHDGSDIGPKKFSAATSVATVKESIVAQWPKGTLHFGGLYIDVYDDIGGKMLLKRISIFALDGDKRLEV